MPCSALLNGEFAVPVGWACTDELGGLQGKDLSDLFLLPVLTGKNHAATLDFSW